MSSPLSPEPYKGVRDFYPAEWARLSAVFEKLRETLAAWGYEEYQASPLEHSELYESKGNEEIIREQTFSFTDRGDRRVTLRPEMTPTLARMVAAKRRELHFPLRWFSIPNVFRYERPQRGRLREHYQLNVDLVGLPEGEADIEVITLAHAVITSLGAKESDFSIRINSRKLLTAAARAAGFTEGEEARGYWQLLDRKAKMSGAEFMEALKEFPGDPLRIIEDGSDLEVAAEKARVNGVIAALRERGVTNAVFDAAIIRGFDYYTGLVFEVFDTNPENSRSMFGGGRYDGLVSLFGGDPIPAIGFGMGDVTLMDFLETHSLTPVAANAPHAYIGTPSNADIPAAQAFAALLRAGGVRTFVNLRDKGLGDQVKDADRRSIPYFIAYGAEETKKGKVRVKHLASGKEKVIATKQVARFLTGKK